MNSQSNSNRRRPRNKRASATSRSNLSRSNLSKCATDYAQSLGNPFNGPADACVPDYPALMTGRFRVWSKGTFTTAVSVGPASGWIAFDPLNAMASDNPCVFYNDPVSTTGDTILTPTITPGSNVPQYSNSPYVLGAFGQAGLQARVVSAGIRIRYIGTELNRGGEIVGLHHPSHSQLSGFTVPLMNTYKESARLPPIREWSTLLYRPVDTGDLNFAIQLAPAAMQFFMGFIVPSGIPGASPYEYEVFSNLEMQGAQVQNKLPSHVDSVGHGAVNAITSMATAIHAPHQETSESIGSALVTAASQYLNMHVSKPSAPPNPNPSIQGGNGFLTDLLKLGGEILPAVLSWF